jgi:hypothetical protein
MELKMLYRPLSPEQLEKYNRRNEPPKETEEYFDEDEEEESSETSEIAKVVVMTEDMFTDAVDADDIQIKTINVGKYDTINLQAELAKSMEMIMSATEREAVDSTMENIRRLVEDSQIPEIKFDDELEQNEIKAEHLQVEVPVSMEVQNTPVHEKVSYEKVLAEEHDGQISLYMPEANILEKQITGQMRIEDVLNEWEKMKTAAQVAIKEAEQKRLNEAKSKALERTENIMVKLSQIISEEEMKMNGQEIAAALEASLMEEEALAQIAAALEEENSNLTDTVQDEKNFNLTNTLQEDKNLNLTDTVQEESVDLAPEMMIVDESLNLVDDVSEASKVSEITEDPEYQEEEDSVAKTIEDRITANFSADIEAIIAKELENEEENDIDAVDSEEEEDAVTTIKGLTLEQQELFAAFLSVRGVEKTLCKIFEPMNIANQSNLPFETSHIAVVGEEQTGKTTLGMAIAKAIQISQHKKSAKVAKITGNSLNSKDIRQLSEKMEGGVLIIEKAGDLTERTIITLMEAVQEAKEEIMLILEDTKAGMDSVLSKDKDFANQFKVKVELPEYNNDELVEFGKEYAKTLMYSFDEMAVLAFYTCLGNLQNDDIPITIEQVRNIIDEAIARSNKKKLKKIKDIIMSKRYDEDKRVILQESDFEGII